MHDPADPPPPADASPLADPTSAATPECETTAAPGGVVAPGAPGHYERLDRRVIGYWLVSGTLSVAMLTALTGVAAMAIDLGRFRTVALWSAAAVLVLMLAWALVSPALAYARWRFAISDDLLVAKSGIFFHEEKVIPVNRLQHVDLSRGPVERLFGLATLVVYTAGSDVASFRLPGLAAARAREIRDQVLAARGDDVI